jgi:predicted PurR-regulated permease PerM
MSDLSSSHRVTRILIITATLVIIVWGINQAQSVLVLLLVSGFLAVIGTEPVLWMERKGVPNVAAVLIVVAAMVVLLLSIGIVVGASLSNFADAVPFYQTRLHNLLLVYKTLLASKGIAITDKVLFGYINPGVVMNLTATMLSALSSMLSNTLLILFTVIFILLEASSFPVKLRSVLDNPNAAFPQATRFVNDIKRYMVIKTLLNLIGGVLVAIWLYILGVDFPILWGFLAFLLHYVPSIGSIVAAVPAVLLALVQLGGGSAALTAAGYLVIGMILGNVVEPKIMGRRLGMSTLVVFLSLIFWGSLLGLVGALLCVPLTMTVKLACESSENTHWIAVLLGPEISSEGIPTATKKDI